MTLLEVLVACGILVVGLSSIAAMLPAAGSRLGQAAREDRAGNLAANALSQARSTGLLAVDLFPDPNRSIAFGPGIESLPSVDGQRFAAAAGPLRDRIDSNRGFLLEDELVFGDPTTAETPVNDFTDGRRSFKEGICWGATLVPTRFPVAVGGTATLSVIVSRKAPSARGIALQSHQGGLYRMNPFDGAVMKTFLKGCSYVIIPPIDATKKPRWYRVLAAWEDRGQGFVAFDGVDVETFAGPSPTVIGFDNILRVDKHEVVLQ